VPPPADAKGEGQGAGDGGGGVTLWGGARPSERRLVVGEGGFATVSAAVNTSWAGQRIEVRC
jgi:hypothetical protein